MRWNYLALALALAACADEQNAGNGAPVDTLATSPDAVPADSMATSANPAAAHPDSVILARYRALLPESVLVREQACPFECCVYGEWTAIDAIPLYESPRATGRPAATVPPGATMQADSGVVYVTSIIVVPVEDTVYQGAERRPWILPGDTLVLLDPIGEGYWTAWRRGQILHSVPPVYDRRPQYDGIHGRTIGQSEREWWVRVRVNGRSGWFRADQHRVRGSDACG